MLKFFMFAVLVVIAGLLSQISGHGRLMEPPNRSSLWRFGYDAPTNYDDNELFCGGYTHLWQTCNGVCGICGDPCEQPQPRDNEAGGKYGLGIIVRNYTSGQVIDVHVELTTNHNGYFEFRLCPNNDIHKIATQDCLDEYLLWLADGSDNKYQIQPNLPMEVNFSIPLRLPAGLTCSQCVLQWHYNTATNWGTCANGTESMGCGPQEIFRGCADVAIYH